MMIKRTEMRNRASESITNTVTNSKTLGSYYNMNRNTFNMPREDKDYHRNTTSGFI
jgi:hypothetical protein